MPGSTITYLPAQIDDFLSYCSIDRDLRPQTIAEHKSILNLFFRSHQQFNEFAFRQFLLNNKDKKDAGTLQGYIFTARVFCEYLIKKGILKENWAKGIKMPKRTRKLPEILSVEEIEAIISANPKYKRPEHRILWDTLFQFLARTGCRISELCHAKVGSLDLHGNTWKVIESKTRSQRIVPLDPEMVRMLKPMIEGKKPDDPIFSAQRLDIRGKELHQTSIRNELRRRVEAAGITKDVSPHTFRHSFITELMKQDISILKISHIVGHEKIQTTANYAKLLFEDLRSSIMRHPIIAKTRNPYEIMQHVKETIKSFQLENDKRFFYELTEGNDGIRLTFFIR